MRTHSRSRIRLNPVDLAAIRHLRELVAKIGPYDGDYDGNHMNAAGAELHALGN